ncbi:Fic family protein [Alphaproteobacteria bacterium]|nr:Fic family protein [Alphaproteobacteria bacterium]
MTAVIEGRVVAGKQTEIKEVKNAYEAYDKIMTFDPYAISDFLKAHKLMTQGLVNEAGEFRSGDVGVFDGNVAIHMGARPQFVPQLIEDLFGWAKASELHAVLKSAILHYEIETIHPFADGNGRMGRLWQALLLAQWNSIFAWIPMESVLYQNRPQYYQAIENAREVNDSSAFIEFTLSALLEIIESQAKHQVKYKDKHQVDLSEVALAVLKSLENNTLSRKEIFEAIGLSNGSRAFRRHIEPLLSCGFIEMTVPDKPNSRLQKYRLTNKGTAAIRDNE